MLHILGNIPRAVVLSCFLPIRIPVRCHRRRRRHHHQPYYGQLLPAMLRAYCADAHLPRTGNDARSITPSLLQNRKRDQQAADCYPSGKYRVRGESHKNEPLKTRARAHTHRKLHVRGAPPSPQPRTWYASVSHAFSNAHRSLVRPTGGTTGRMSLSRYGFMLYPSAR